jgi:two-component system cell cycle sensor histidine kinase PleC
MSEFSAKSRPVGADLRTAPDQRKAARRVREVREKLTSTGSGNRSIDLDLMREFAESRVSAFPLMATIAVALSAICLIWAPLERVLVWSCLVIGLLVYSFQFYRRSIPAIASGERTLRAWRQRILVLEAAQGVGWSLLAVTLLDVNDEAARSFLFLALLLVGAMGSMILALIPAAVYANLVPVTLAVAGFLLKIESNPAPPLLIAAAAVAYFIFLSRRFYATSLSSLLLRLEKDGLIEELEHAKLSSDEARQKAEEASLAKSRFLATMSHELRTPLNAILGFSEVMKGELFGPHAVPAYKDYSSDIHSSGQHLLALINEILDLSRVEAGRYELKEEAVSLALIVEDCTHLLTLRAEKRSIVITESIERNLPRIWADERAVRQVVLNLLTNAIKFTPPGGGVFIKVGWTAVGGQYICVRDTGTGIPPEEIPVVLSSFGRGSMAQKNADEGSGLGLPIVKGLVELHGGRFTLKSEVNVGTEAIVILPPERVMDALAPVDVAAEPPSTYRARAA